MIKWTKISRTKTHHAKFIYMYHNGIVKICLTTSEKTSSDNAIRDKISFIKKKKKENRSSQNCFRDVGKQNEENFGKNISKKPGGNIVKF